MMPPHLNSTEPADGGVLESDVVVLRGYSLVFTEPDSELTIVPEAGGAPLPFTWEMDDTEEGEGDMPGAVQVRCVLRVKPEGLVRGGSYRLEYVGESIGFTRG
jgi:hypothetical protein